MRNYWEQVTIARGESITRPYTNEMVSVHTVSNDTIARGLIRNSVWTRPINQETRAHANAHNSDTADSIKGNKREREKEREEGERERQRATCRTSRTIANEPS